MHYDCTEISGDEVKAWVAEAANMRRLGAHETFVEIPCCMMAKILKPPAKIAGVDDVAAVHSSRRTRLLPGLHLDFPYLGGLDERLAKIPRLQTPRQLVPRGSVGVAAGQTGVYRAATPGGWRCAGAWKDQRHALRPCREPPSLLQPGDAVRFC